MPLEGRFLDNDLLVGDVEDCEVGGGGRGGSGGVRVGGGGVRVGGGGFGGGLVGGSGSCVSK